jgi:ribosomal protein S18 acetylase RimI-like enzyme
MIGTIVEDLKKHGLQGLWVGLDPRNHRARQFYTKIGFRPIAGANENTLGLRFEDFVPYQPKPQ